MKYKIINLLIIMALAIFIFTQNNTQTVSASTAIDSTVTIAASETNDTTTYSGDIVISLNSGNVFVVESGATLIVENSTITASGSVSLTNVFYVKTGGKLILNNVTLDASVIATNGIYNAGEVELNGNTSFSSNITTSIYNNSSTENSLKIFSATIPSIYIATGYITVFENTSILGSIKVSCDGEYDGKVVVRGSGTNVFASKLIDKFVYSSITGSSSFYLDYIGDECTLPENIDGEIASQGDIVITKYTLTANQVLYSANYCTSSSFISNNASSNKFPIYKSNQSSLYMNNYTANTSNITYTLYSEYANYCFVNLTVNTYKSGSDSAESTTTYKYPAGSNYAVFVDIPSGYELDSVSVSNSYFSVADNKYANSYYMRPIIQYVSETIDCVDCQVDFTFKEIKNEATLSVVKEDNVELKYESELIVGENYTFTIPLSSEYKILSVEFNGKDVDLVKDENEYSFSLTMLENNTLTINSLDLPYDIVVTPNFTFTYGDEISLTQDYYVEATNETITLNFIGEMGVNVGFYDITGVACTNSDYNVTLSSGEHKYTITKQVVDLSGITINPCIVTYSTGLNITVDMFVLNLPSSLTATATLVNGVMVAGEQDVTIEIFVKNGNYTIANDQQTIYVTTLTINRQTLDTSSCSIADDLTTEYDGHAKELEVSGLTDLIAVNFSYYKIGEDDSLTSTPSAINAGKYLVEAQLYSTSTFYITSTLLRGYITISKSSINLTNYASKIAMFTFTYDKTSHVIDFDLYDEYLPDSVTRGEVLNNGGHTDVGTQIITINLLYDSDNYTCEDTLESKLVISPKKITVALEQNNFLYDGSTPTLIPIISDVIDGDNVSVDFENFTYSSVGSYEIEFDIDNTNYYVETNYVTITISANTIDISNTIRFDNIACEYDGLRHLPVISGTLPLGISYEIDNDVPCINVGVYTVKCTFSSSNPNYITPEPIYAKVIISEKPIFVEFNLGDDMVANGQKKEIGVSFSGVVDGDDIGYKVTYSGDCVLAGEYVCTVTLDPLSNYKIINSNSYEFIIFSSTASFVSDDLNLTLEGLFHPASSIIVNDTSSSLSIVNVVADIDCKSYSSFKISYQNYSTDPVTLKVNNVNSINSKYLHVYRVVNGKLEKIDYNMDNNVISFQIQGSEEILFIEENSLIIENIMFIFAIIFLSAISISLLTTFIIINNNRKKLPSKKAQ